MNFRNAIYLKNGNIRCEIEHPSLGWIPYTAVKDSNDEFGKEAWLILSKSNKVKDYVEKSAPEEVISDFARAERNRKLRALDIIISNPLRWDSFTQDQKEAYKKYRQKLLDVPQQPGFPNDIVWPKIPE